MEKNNLIDLTSTFSSKSIEHKKEILQKCKLIINQANRNFFNSFNFENDIITADLLFNYFNVMLEDLSKEYKLSKNEESKFYIAIFLYLMGSDEGKEFLLQTVKSGEINKAIFVINKFATRGDLALSSIIYERLTTVALDNVDFTLSLLEAAFKLKIKLPSTFTRRLTSEIPWQIKSVLKDDFNMVFD